MHAFIPPVSNFFPMLRMHGVSFPAVSVEDGLYLLEHVAQFRLVYFGIVQHAFGREVNYLSHKMSLSGE